MEEISYACETVPEAEAMRIELGRGVTISIDGDDPDVLVFVDPNLYTGRIDILSPSSPIGEAVLGASLGDVVMAQVGPSVCRVP